MAWSDAARRAAALARKRKVTYISSSSMTPSELKKHGFRYPGDHADIQRATLAREKQLKKAAALREARTYHRNASYGPGSSKPLKIKTRNMLARKTAGMWIRNTVQSKKGL